MAMASATLATELANMSPTATEAAAINTFANAWGTYFSGAMCGVVPFNDVGSACKNTMKAALVGLSTAGLAAIQAGVVAYWGAIIEAPTTFFAGVTVATPPPGITGIAAALAPVCTANTAGSKSLVDSTADIAAALHTTNLGGTGTIPPAGPAPIA